MATPLPSSSIGTCTRTNPSSLANPALDPKRPLRARLHMLSSRTLLVNLGQEALCDIHSLFLNLPILDIMDIYGPLNFANIQGYPHNLPNNGLDKLPVFQGNNAITVKNHLYTFQTWWAKFAHVQNYEDVQMKCFVLTLEQDVMDWFRDSPDHNIDSYDSLLDAFREKFGNKKEDQFLAKAISIIKKKENETCEEFNRRFNGMLKEISIDYKPTEKMLLEYYLGVFNPHCHFL